MAKTSTKVFVLEVMGRHAGWIAAAGGLARIPIFRSWSCSPRSFDQDGFLAAVKTRSKPTATAPIVVSEGVATRTASFLAEQGTRDAFGHAQLGGVAPVVANMIKDALGYKYHWAVADYLQRAARHRVGQRSRTGRARQAGVEMALAGKTPRYVVLKNEAGRQKTRRFRTLITRIEFYRGTRRRS